MASRALLGMLLVVAAATACSSSIPLNQSPIGKPRWTIGDRWMMKTVDLWKKTDVETFEQSVAAVEGDSVWLERKTLSHVSGRTGSAGTDRYDGATWTAVDPAVVEGKVLTLAFPLFVGKTWEYEYTAVDASGNRTLQTRNAKVETWEVVAVPAGTFNALKVVVDGRWRAPIRDAMFTGKVTETLWYSPEAKRWVKREVTSRTPEGGITDQFRDELVRIALEK
jgi:hypothetical protein